MKNLITICILFLCVNNLKGQNKSDILENFFNYYNELGVFNGVVLAAENDEIIFQKEYGFADFENKTPLTRNSLFAIGSTTKTLTATAIMMMEENKLLSYDDTISKYLTDLPSFADSVTIRQLLTMTSGIPDYFRDMRITEYTVPAVIDILSKTDKLLFKPGANYNYSSTNYLLLAKIIEYVSGMTWGEYLKKNIFIPSGMNNTYAYPFSDSIPGRVEAYQFINWVKADMDLKLATYGGGNVYSCVDDLYSFTKALEGGLLLKSYSSAYDTSQLMNPMNDSYYYGFGWIILRKNPGVVFHNGAVGGFNTILWRNYEDHSTLIILCNNWWMSRIPGIISGAQNIMLGKDFEYDKVTCTVPFYEIWWFKGFSAAMTWLSKEYSNPSGKFSFQPAELNYLGYLFIGKKQFKEAIEVFKFCVQIYANEYNLWDSLGEAYMINGDKQNAIINYKKSLELNPDNSNARNMLKKLEE